MTNQDRGDECAQRGVNGGTDGHANTRLTADVRPPFANVRRSALHSPIPGRLVASLPHTPDGASAHANGPTPSTPPTIALHQQGRQPVMLNDLFIADLRS